MTDRTRVSLTAAAFALAFAAAQPAFAQADPWGDDKAAQPAAPEAPTPATPLVTAPLPAPAPGAAQPTAPVKPAIGIERLADVPENPEMKLRGIPGSSVWITRPDQMHGLQWPYYPRTGIAVSGSIFLDTGYEKLDRLLQGQDDFRYWLQDGRFVLRITPTYTDGDYFVQAIGEIVANKDQSKTQPNIIDADDVAIKVGKWNAWDVQIGRFQTWEVVHLGMGLDLFTLERRGAYDDTAATPNMYIGDYMWDRRGGPGRIAAHLYPTSFLRLELAGELGFETPSNTIGGRPAAILDFGRIKVKGAVEYRKSTDYRPNIPSNTVSRGGAVGVIAIPFDFLELGADFGQGLIDVTDQSGSLRGPDSTTTTTFGGFLNVRPVKDFFVGGGLQYTLWENQQLDTTTGKYGTSNHLQAYGAVQYLVLGQLYVKAVVGYALAHYEPVNATAFDNEMVSARLRVMYLF